MPFRRSLYPGAVIRTLNFDPENAVRRPRKRGSFAPSWRNTIITVVHKTLKQPLRVRLTVVNKGCNHRSKMHQIG